MSKYANRKYVIIDSNEVSSMDFAQLLNNSNNGLRYKVDNSQTFVKFEGSTPSFLNSKTQYTVEQLKTILNNAANGWPQPDDI